MVWKEWKTLGQLSGDLDKYPDGLLQVIHCLVRGVHLQALFVIDYKMQ